MDNNAATQIDASPDGFRDLPIGERGADRGGAVAVSQPVSENAALISMIERAARDPAVDLDKMERLFAMKERMETSRAKADYLTALSRMQPSLPIIKKSGEISRTEKDENGKKQQAKATKYAKWEDAVEAVNPILSEHGFSLSFRIAQPSADRVVVTAVLGHSSGHAEETSMSLPIDNTGAKNSVQGWGSSVSYGKRYAAFALLNIAARGEDDDGNRAGAPTSAPVTEQDLANFRKALAEKGVSDGEVCQMFSVECIEDLTRKQFDDAVRRLAKTKARAQK